MDYQELDNELATVFEKVANLKNMCLIVLSDISGIRRKLDKAQIAKAEEVQRRSK